MLFHKDPRILWRHHGWDGPQIGRCGVPAFIVLQAGQGGHPGVNRLLIHAEWISNDTPSDDGTEFMRICLSEAADTVRKHVPERRRFFGVGVAAAADLQKDSGQILRAPVFGWDHPIALGQMVREMLDAPLAMDTPTSAINKAEADCGLGGGVLNLTTLHCSLGFGIGIRQRGDDGGPLQEFGRVLTESKAPDGTGQSLTEDCGGLSVLLATRGRSAVRGQSDAVLGAMLLEDIERAQGDDAIKGLLRGCGRRAAERFGLVFDLCQPERLLLAGVLAKSGDYVQGFEQALPPSLGQPDRAPEILCSDMTPAGACRWLALRENVAMGNLDLSAVKPENAA